MKLWILGLVSLLLITGCSKEINLEEPYNLANYVRCLEVLTPPLTNQDKLIDIERFMRRTNQLSEAVVWCSQYKYPATPGILTTSPKP